MDIIRDDCYVNELNDKQLVMLKKIFDHFSPQLKSKVYLFETIHGFIVNFIVKKPIFSFDNKDVPARIDESDVLLLAEISPICRFICVGTSKIQVGF